MIDLTANCVAHYKMNDNAPNTVVVDSKGYTNGTAQQNTEDLTTNGKVGEALSFDGASDRVNIPDPSQIDFTAAPLSVFAWIYPIYAGHSGYIFCKSDTSFPTVQYAISWGISNVFIAAFLEGLERATSAELSVMWSRWSFVGFTWDGTYVKCFVNGSQSGNTGTYVGSLTSRPYCNIGMGFNVYFSGPIDNVMIFNKALSQAEIDFLYYNGNGTENLDSGSFPVGTLSEMWGF